METGEDDLPSGPTFQPTRPRLRYSPSMESFRSEGTEQDDDKVTNAGQSSTGQAGETSHGHAGTGNCRSPQSSEHSEGSQRDLKEEARGLHLEIAETC